MRAVERATRVAYDAFVVLFPLMLLVATVVSYVAQRNADLRAAVLESPLRDFPIVRAQLAVDARPLSASALAVAVGGLVVVWASRGRSETGRLAIALAAALGAGLTALTLLIALWGSLGGIVALGCNLALSWLALRVFTPTHELRLAVAVVGVAWSLLHVGAALIAEAVLKSEDAVLGYFGLVVGVLVWLFVGTLAFFAGRPVSMARRSAFAASNASSA